MIDSIDSKDKLLGDIEKEIGLTENKEDQLKQQERLKEVYRYYDEEDKVISSIEAKKVIEKLKLEGEKQLIIKSGYSSLDKIIDGFREGNLIVVSGPTGHGKTLIAQCLTQNFLKNEIYSLWFSYEVPVEEFLEKFGESTSLFYLPKILKYNTTQWIEQRIIESIVKYNTKVVFIDHLHYILDIMSLGNGINASLQLGSILRELKTIAIRWKVVIFLVSHITKITLDKAPDLSDLRDSSFTGQEADMVLMMWRKIIEGSRPPVLSDESILSVQKNRRTGKMGNIELIYVDGRLKELSEMTERMS